MQVQVTGVDKRQWVVRRRVEWRTWRPHDEPPAPPGRCAGVVTAVVVLAGLALVARHLYPGAWNLMLGVPVAALVAAVLVVLVVAGVRWVLGRPRSLVAQYESEHADDGTSERWVGMVDGVSAGRRETAATVRSLRNRGTPAGADSPLQPIV